MEEINTAYFLKIYIFIEVNMYIYFLIHVMIINIISDRMSLINWKYIFESSQKH